MDATLYDRDNPIMDWLNGSMSQSKPILDHQDDKLFCREIYEEKSSDDILDQPIKGWTTKRKHASGGRKGKGKRGKKKGDDEEDEVVSEADTETLPGSPTYDDTDGSTSHDNDDRGADGGETVVKYLKFPFHL